MVGPDALDTSGGTVLSDSECRQLLAGRTLGRVGLTSGALPVIVPVEYEYEHGVITFRTEPSAELRAAVHGHVLAFEVDAYDADSGEGWSVLVHGRAMVLTAEREAAPPPDGRPDESRRHYARLNCEIVSGRRLVPSRS